jgi:putative FmdB family regulatory protein
MPTYDYECKKCGDTFEAFQSMMDEPLSTCEKCGGELRRLIGAGMGIIFKGSGFYVTDNRSSSGNGKKAASSENSGSSESKSDGKSQSSSEGKKDSSSSSGSAGKKETSSAGKK